MLFILLTLFFSLDTEGSFPNHSRLRTPPLPLSHSHSPSQHHSASVGSLSHSNYTQRSNPSPAPTDSSAPNDGPASAQDPGSAQDNWLLNSNVPLETRYVWDHSLGGMVHLALASATPRQVHRKACKCWLHEAFMLICSKDQLLFKCLIKNLFRLLKLYATPNILIVAYLRNHSGFQFYANPCIRSTCIQNMNKYTTREKHCFISPKVVPALMLLI